MSPSHRMMTHGVNDTGWGLGRAVVFSPGCQRSFKNNKWCQGATSGLLHLNLLRWVGPQVPLISLKLPRWLQCAARLENRCTKG